LSESFFFDRKVAEQNLKAATHNSRDSRDHTSHTSTNGIYVDIIFKNIKARRIQKL